MVKKRILIVEDEHILALMLEQMVARMGHEVVEKVSTGKAAIETAKTLLPDLILMDIRLKGTMDGIEAISKIQNEHDIPVIYTTGNTDKKYRERVEKTHYIDFLVKPISKKALLHSLDLAS